MTDRGIVPDTKDWTWVLERPCAECGFVADALDRADVPALLRRTSEEWVSVLARQDIGMRPSPAVWSPLEYACHVRDVFVVFDERVQLMLTRDDPQFANWDQDTTAVESAYGEQDAADVARALQVAGTVLADRFAAVTDEQWSRAGLRSDGARFTVESIGRYLAHDDVHHLVDVGAREKAST